MLVKLVLLLAGAWAARGAVPTDGFETAQISGLSFGNNLNQITQFQGTTGFDCRQACRSATYPTCNLYIFNEPSGDPSDPFYEPAICGVYVLTGTLSNAENRLVAGDNTEVGVVGTACGDGQLPDVDANGAPLACTFAAGQTASGAAQRIRRRRERLARRAERMARRAGRGY